MLCQRNKFFCDSCCGLQEAEKRCVLSSLVYPTHVTMGIYPDRMKIKKLPNVLALHLKRFKYQEDLRKYIKLTYRVAFPFELRLFNTADEVDDPDRLYELFAIVVHIGSGPHHGHYVAIVKGPHSWLMFDDDKIEPIKESEIPRYFGDAASGSAYVLYYQTVDLDLASLGLKPPAPPVVPDVVVSGAPDCGAKPETNGGAAPDLSEPALPPGLGDSHVFTSAPTPTPVPAVTPVPPPPHIPSAPSSPSLVSPPLVSPEALPTRKKSLPAIRIPGSSDSTTASPTTPIRTGGLFHTFRTSPSSSKIRPSTAEGVVSLPTLSLDTPPVPPVPSLYINGKELPAEKEKEKVADKEQEPQREREKEEGRSSKEFDRKPSLWFKRWSNKSPKDEREKEKDKDKKDLGTPPVPPIVAAPSQATTSAVALSSVPSQSDAGSSVSGASSLWRRGSARLGHSKHPSATFSSTTLGEFDAAGSHPLPRHHQHSQPPPLPMVPQTPHTTPGSLPNADSSSPSTSTSHSPAPTAPAHHPPLASSTFETLIPSSTPDHSDDEADDDDDDDEDHDEADADDDHANGQHKKKRHHRWALPRPPAMLRSGRQRGRPYSMHESGSGTPRERSASPRTHAESSPHSAPTAEEEAALSPLANGAPSSSLSSSSSVGKGKDKDKEQVGLRRAAARKLSLNVPMFGLGLGLGLGGREKDRERDVGKKDHDGKKLHKMRGAPNTAFSSGSAAALASVAP
jgi:ubiquitin carboxyl-terminal hydrolase 9/13